MWAFLFLSAPLTEPVLCLGVEGGAPAVAPPPPEVQLSAVDDFRLGVGVPCLLPPDDVAAPAAVAPGLDLSKLVWLVMGGGPGPGVGRVCQSPYSSWNQVSSAAN